MLSLQAKVGLGIMAVKGYSAFPKALALLQPHHQIVYGHIRIFVVGGSYPSAELQSVYSNALADLTRKLVIRKIMRITWLTANEVNRRKSNPRAKLKVASQEERRQKWKQHLKNLLRNPPEITDKPSEKLLMIN